MDAVLAGKELLGPPFPSPTGYTGSVVPAYSPDGQSVFFLAGNNLVQEDSKSGIVLNTYALNDQPVAIAFGPTP